MSTPSTPLSALECELLEVIAQNRDDQAAFTVLADYWLEAGETVRGQALQLELRDDITDVDSQLMFNSGLWRERLIAAGFAERDLTLDRCLLERPLVVDADSALDGHPDLVRLSPRYYRRGAEAGTGWDAVVHVGQAVTPRTTTRVALKIAQHPDAMALLAREDMLLRRFDHPNLPRTHGFAILPATTAMRSYASDHARELMPPNHALVLDWRGKDLRSLVSEARDHRVKLGVDVGISIVLQLCDAIAALHDAGMFHSEVRPDHVLLGEAGVVTLIDFGFVHGDPPLPDWVHYSPYRTSPVRLDAARLSYISPEQGRGMDLDRRTDVFSAGLVAYLLIVGRSATAGAQSDFERVQRIVQTDLVPPQGTPPALAAVLRRALARERENRYPSITEFRAALAAAAGGIEVGPHVIARRLVELGVPA